MSSLVKIDDVIICPELCILLKQAQINIDNHSHKDVNLEGGGILRGWKLGSDSMLIHKLQGDVDDLAELIDQMENPIGGYHENVPTPEQILREAAKVVGRAMQICDVSGGCGVHG